MSTDGQNMVDPYHKTLFRHKIEQSIDICHNMYEPSKHHAKGKKARCKKKITCYMIHSYESPE
jgi:hypothetical protein